MKHYYEVNESRVRDEQGRSYITYGVQAVDEDGVVAEAFADIFFEKEAAADLVRRCNEGELSLIHFGDVVEDELAKYSML